MNDPLTNLRTSLKDRLAVKSVPAGTVLFQPGDAMLGYVIVLEGRVEVRLTGETGRQVTLYDITPGEACLQSSLGLLGGEADYSAEAVAMTDTKLSLLPPDAFSAALADAGFRDAVCAGLAGRVQHMMHRIETLSFAPLPQRLARVLLAEARDGRALTLTHDDLARLVGASREAVSRRLSAWDKAGLIATARGQITLKDLPGLEDIAGPV